LKAGLGDVITAAVKEATPESQVKRGSVVKAVWCACGKSGGARMARTSGLTTTPRLLINDAGEPVGTRVFGPVARELREKKIHQDCFAGPEVW